MKKKLAYFNTHQKKKKIQIKNIILLIWGKGFYEDIANNILNIKYSMLFL